MCLISFINFFEMMSCSYLAYRGCQVHAVRNTICLPGDLQIPLGCSPLFLTPWRYKPLIAHELWREPLYAIRARAGQRQRCWGGISGGYVLYAICIGCPASGNGTEVGWMNSAASLCTQYPLSHPVFRRWDGLACGPIKKRTGTMPVRSLRGKDWLSRRLLGAEVYHVAAPNGKTDESDVHWIIPSRVRWHSF